MNKEEIKKNYQNFLENCSKFKSIDKSDMSKFYYKFDWSDKKQTCTVLSWEKETKEGMFANVQTDTNSVVVNAFIKFEDDTFVGGKVQ